MSKQAEIKRPSATARPHRAEGARRAMERFYRLVATHHGEPLDPRRAAELEVGWWRVHRMHQREDSGEDESSLVAPLSAL